MKSQFEPDILVGIVIVILVGLGGVLFIQTYIKGVTFKGIISAQDREADLSCFLILSSHLHDYYIHRGVDFSKGVYQKEYLEMQNYYGGYNYKAESKIEYLGYLFGDSGMVSMEYHVSPTPREMRGNIYCTYGPVFSPYGKGGIAYLYEKS